MVAAAPLLFVLLWSSSFVTAKVGLRHLSPLLFVAIRLVACALVLAALMLVLRRSWRSLADGRWFHCAVAGALLNGVSLMGPHVALVTTPAAQIALVQSLTPLLTAACGVLLLHEKLRALQWLGLVLGVAGVGLVVGGAALESAARLQGLLLAFVGVVGLVAGTLYFGRFCRGVPPLPSATVQFASAAIIALLGTALLETPHAEWTGDTVAAVGLEHADGVARRHGALFVHAGAPLGRPRQRQFLSGARDDRDAGLAVARRAAGRECRHRPGAGLGRLLAGQCGGGEDQRAGTTVNA